MRRANLFRRGQAVVDTPKILDGVKRAELLEALEPVRLVLALVDRRVPPQHPSPLQGVLHREVVRVDKANVFVKQVLWTILC